MSEQIVLDLGEYGEIIIESTETRTNQPVMRGEMRGEERTRRRVDPSALLRGPLTGLGKVFMATLPQPNENDPYEIEEFSVEFEVSIEAEAGNVVAKIKPSGALKCTYTWKRRKAEEETVAAQ